MLTVIGADAEEALAQATAALDAGGLVVFAGDLRYLVAADALDDAAVERLLLAKGRGADRGLTVLVGGYEDLHHVAFGGSEARALAEAHWPGAAMLVLRARPWMPDGVTGAAETVRVSVPAQAFARALAKRFGPLAVATARRTGGAEALDVDAARAALGAEVALYVDGGRAPGGEASIIRGGAPAAG